MNSHTRAPHLPRGPGRLSPRRGDVARTVWGPLPTHPVEDSEAGPSSPPACLTTSSCFPSPHFPSSKVGGITPARLSGDKAQ